MDKGGGIFSFFFCRMRECLRVARSVDWLTDGNAYWCPECFNHYKPWKEQPGANKANKVMVYKKIDAVLSESSEVTFAQCGKGDSVAESALCGMEWRCLHQCMIQLMQLCIDEARRCVPELGTALCRCTPPSPRTRIR